MINEKVSLEEFKSFAKDVAPAARAVLLAQAYAETMREKVDAYIQPIFDSYHFVAGPLVSKIAGEPLKTPRDLYLVADLDEDLVKNFYEDCDAAHRAHGFTGPKGYCPALIAEDLLIQAQNALINLAEPLFGVETYMLSSEQRAKYLKLLIGAALKEEVTA